MAPKITLYSHLGYGPNPLKVAIVLTKLGIDFDVIPLIFGDDAEKGVKSEKYLALCPNGRVPLLAVQEESGEPYYIWESAAIMYYLCEAGWDKEGSLFGRTIQEKGQVMQWLMHQMSGLGPSQGNIFYSKFYWESKYDEKPPVNFVKRYVEETHRLYSILEEQLARQKKEKNSDWLVLDRPTIADYSFFVWTRLYKGAEIKIDEFPNIKRWNTAMAEDEQVKAADAKLPKE